MDMFRLGFGKDKIYQTDEKTLHCYNGSHRHFSRYSNKEWCGLGKKLKECSFRDGEKSNRCFPKEGSMSLRLRDRLYRGGSIKTKTKTKTKTKRKKRKTRKRNTRKRKTRKRKTRKRN